MRALFNKNDKGNKEIKAFLAHLDADYKYVHLETDIEHEAINLAKIIGKQTYDAIVDLYELPDLANNATQAQIDQRAKDMSLVKKAQLPILVFAELQFAPNNDISTSNNGRVVKLTDYERQPWEWQLNKADSASLRRGYRALDILISTLDEYEFTPWINSAEYQKAKQYFVYSTDQFDDIFGINASRQLYMRLQNFMNDVEEDEILPIIGTTRYDNLKAKILSNSLTTTDKVLLKKVQRPIVYRSLQDAFKTLPVEMFPSNLITYREKGKIESNARAEVMLFFKGKADMHLKKLESYITENTITNEPTPELDLTQNMEGDKYINL